MTVAHVPDSSSALVRMTGVSKAYEAPGGRTPVLRDLSFTLARGTTTSLMGASGSGKTTLLSLLAGLTAPDSGRLEFDGEDLDGLDDLARAGLRARRIGVVMQGGNLIPFLTAVENVALAIELANGDRPRARARELLLEVGLEGRVNHLPRRMSGGEAQRVSLAMALANRPDLLLADEVTGELDAANAERVMTLILSSSRDHGLTVLLVTHDEQVAAHAQTRLRLADGQVHER